MVADTSSVAGESRNATAAVLGLPPTVILRLKCPDGIHPMHRRIGYQHNRSRSIKAATTLVFLLAVFFDLSQLDVETLSFICHHGDVCTVG